MLAAVAGDADRLDGGAPVRRPAAASPCRSSASFACTAPLATYATQVYPEIPAALAVMVAVAALTGPLDRRGRAVVRRSPSSRCRGCRSSTRPSPRRSSLSALLAAARSTSRLGRRGRRAGARRRRATCVAHRAIYGGWTAYATGDYFAETGEFTVVGSRPELPRPIATPGRAARRRRLRHRGVDDRLAGRCRSRSASSLRRRPPDWDVARRCRWPPGGSPRRSSR